MTRSLDGRAQQTNLDGRSGKDNRALVDMGNQPIVSFNEDYENGVSGSRQSHDHRTYSTARR